MLLLLCYLLHAPSQRDTTCFSYYAIYCMLHHKVTLHASLTMLFIACSITERHYMLLLLCYLLHAPSQNDTTYFSYYAIYCLLHHKMTLHTSLTILFIACSITK